MDAKWMVAVLGVVTGTAVAGGPRFLAKTTDGGAPMAWAGTKVMYSTDPGALNSSVTHAQADAVVAAAAAVWAVPTSGIAYAQGGTLAEHVSSANTYFDGTSVVFPADVQVSNAAAVPVAVMYDSDGSVTDLLLGSGASDPGSCRQNEVTESVDGFGATTIQHAVVVVNGRCVGASTDSLNQLKYVLVRKFGRVLGLAWSQVNDNVFTGATTPTSDQMAYWPVMHPIDVICGTYTYTCMVNPFTLRADDLSALALLYPVAGTGNATAAAGWTADGTGSLIFGGSYTGMDQANITAVIYMYGWSTPLGYQVTSGVTGRQSTEDFGNPVSGLVGAGEQRGASDPFWNAAGFEMRRIPILTGGATVSYEMEPINPLYTGAYTVNATAGAPVSPSGTMVTDTKWNASSNGAVMNEVLQSSTSWSCAGNAGQESQPVAVDASGFWSGAMCSRNSPNWGSVAVRAGRTWTLEVTATDETGVISMTKAQPVLGVWNAADAVRTLPTVAAMAVPMNGRVVGLTQLGVPAGVADASYRFTVADAHGHGRMDLAFRARLLYADAVTPAITTVSGGQITITGMGFANGDSVLVNGVTAKVVSWSPTQIVATAPSLAVAKATAGVPVSVEVLDLTTGGSTVMSGALSYPGGGAYGLVKVSAPATLETGVTAATAFAVKVVAADGVTAIPGASVKFTVTSGSAGLVGCGAAASCTLTANASGVVGTLVSGVMAGNVVLTATEVTGGASVQVSVVDADPVRSAVIATPAAYVALGASVQVPVTLNAVQDGAAAGGVAVSWSVSAGIALSSAAGVTAGDGSAGVSVLTSAMGAGTGTVRGCVWSTVCASWSVVAVDPSQWTPAVVSGSGQSVSYTASLGNVVLRVTDGAGHAVIGAAVNVEQTVSAWEGVCSSGRCAAAPVLAASSASAVTDANGLVTVTPLQVSGVPEVVNVAVSAGTSGFLSLALVKVP